jgi:uncharacterized protein DUF6596
VLAVIYLIYNEGYSGRVDLGAEAIGLGRVLAALLRDEPEAEGLLALMVIHRARRRARFSGEALVSLHDQDRSLWDMGEIAAGRAVLDRALAQAGDPAADRTARGDRGSPDNCVATQSVRQGISPVLLAVSAVAAHRTHRMRHLLRVWGAARDVCRTARQRQDRKNREFRPPFSRAVRVVLQHARLQLTLEDHLWMHEAVGRGVHGRGPSPKFGYVIRVQDGPGGYGFAQ